MSQIVTGDRAPESQCTGRNSRFGGTWVSSMYGPVGKQVYELLVTVPEYQGPNTYRPPEVAVQVVRLDGSAIWRTSGGDPATFTVNPDEESGSIDASLTDVNDSTTGLRVTGRWSCLT